MNNLYRELAPVSAPAWLEIEKEAQRTLKTMLAGRRIVDFVGPQGFAVSAVGTGRAVSIPPPHGAVEAHLRQVQPLVEIRVPFELPRSEIEAIDRGAADADLDSVIAAARRIAIAEDVAIFHGYPAANILGICQSKAGNGLPLGDDFKSYPTIIAGAINKLRDAGVDGPYAVALSERCYTGLTETTTGGYPVLDHIRRIVEGPLVWAPGLTGVVVVSLRGGDFQLVVGRDFSIGYLDHDAKKIGLYIEESFTFRLLSPQAAVPLAHEGKNAA
ncbi:family 1 encapsulin nanocompartment shell protein [Telmatospirillum siberiense]|uniref:Bacteriocin n=1 Tax=Telmatospirillum siberiense TaxID=382514 RepID=A0A2N3PM42_9PROT|nr:family 1 encapsulin nanocompartment shell protein [Telmatospirillum siberiense]PKU21465.1 bacteriocin [Telmatospirillum siberiense]